MQGDGGGRKRTPQQRELDNERIAKLWCLGWSHRRIGEDLGVSRQQITQDLAKLHAKWAASAIGAIEERKAKEFARIDHLEAVAWEAWERSCKDAETSHVRTETEGAKDEQGRLVPTKTVSEKTTRGQSGDPRFLERVSWCINKRCELLGLDPVKRLDVLSGGQPLFKLYGFNPDKPDPADAGPAGAAPV